MIASSLPVVYVMEGCALGLEWAWNGHFTLTPLGRLLVLPFVLCCINTDAPGPLRASKQLKPLHGDSPCVAWLATTTFIASRVSYCATVQVG
jgi:hypothetical protein